MFFFLASCSQFMYTPFSPALWTILNRLWKIYSSSLVFFSANFFFHCLVWFLSSLLEVLPGWKLWTRVWGLLTLSLVVLWSEWAIHQKTKMSVALGLSLRWLKLPKESLLVPYPNNRSLAGYLSTQHPVCTPKPVVFRIGSILHLGTGGLTVSLPPP